MASNESKTLWIAVGALVAFALMMVWVLSGPGEEQAEGEPVAAEPVSAPLAEAPKPAAAAPKPAAAVGPAAQPAATEPAIDPMVDVFAGPMPDFMVAIHTRVLDKKPLGVEDQKALYNFGKEHKDDARPQLLLAWDSTTREWDGIAVRMYRIAYRADHRAKNDPHMLTDLISVVSRFEKTEYREAIEILGEAYGRTVLPRIDEELAKLRDAGELTRSTRLERARAEIAKLPK